MSAAKVSSRRSPPASPPTVTILGVPVHQVTMEKALALIQDFIYEPKLHQIATANPEFVMVAQRDPEFLSVLRSVDLCLPDGIGLLLAARFLGQSLSERVAGSDLVFHLARLAADEGWSLFLLGAAPGVAEEAGRILQDRYPGLHIAGTFAGSPDPVENEAIVRCINESEAKILYVAYGAPNQDKWIARNRTKLTTARVAIGVGGALDFITGRAVRAPGWIQRLGLEWLHRLFREPWRWRRMLALPHFAWRVLFQERVT